MLYIHTAIKKLIDENHIGRESLSAELKVSSASISSWYTGMGAGDYAPKFKTAILMYKKYGLQLYPYSLEALKEESANESVE